MKYCYFFLLLLFTLVETSFSQNATISKYDSSYDFNQITERNRNPKELIGQQLVFAERSTVYVRGSKYALFNGIRDTFFICFSTPSTKKIAELVTAFPANSTEFKLVDCTRHPSNYSLRYLTDSATTNTYKPKAIVTEEHTFALHRDDKVTKAALVVGTPYFSLAGKTFMIKDASCYYDYYDSQVTYFFNLIDPENKEVTLYLDYNQPLEQMIHIKGYVKKVDELYYNKEFTFKNGRVQQGTNPKKYIYDVVDSVGIPVEIESGKWRAGHLRYISTPQRYFQTLYLDLYNEKQQKVYLQFFEYNEELDAGL